jgi:hypothetical protein
MIFVDEPEPKGRRGLRGCCSCCPRSSSAPHSRSAAGAAAAVALRRRHSRRPGRDLPGRADRRGRRPAPVPAHPHHDDPGRRA